MKYILMMTATKARVDSYRTWSKEDIDTHMTALESLIQELGESGEFVADQGLTAPDAPMVVRGEKDGIPITDGIFPESKEFLLGYWIVDTESPERAYAIAGRLSALPGSGGAPMNMPVEVRELASHPLKWSGRNVKKV